MTPTPEEVQQAREEVVSDILHLLKRKANNYGRNIQRHGIRGVVIRMSDKMMRLENLVLGDRSDSVGEAISDTFVDQAGYAITTLALMKLGDLSFDGEWKEANGVTK